MFHLDEQVDKHAWDTSESCHDTYLWAAQRLAVLFGETGQRGFAVFAECGGRAPVAAPFRPADIRIEVLARLCLVANTKRVPPVWRSAAAGAGGIAPRPDLGLRSSRGWHSCAKPGDEHCQALCQELCAIRPRPALPAWCGGGFNVLIMMNAKNHGNVVECALAAADCARAAEQHRAQPTQYPNWAREFPWIVGGGRGSGDDVTKWIQDELYKLIGGYSAPGGRSSSWKLADDRSGDHSGRHRWPPRSNW